MYMLYLQYQLKTVTMVNIKTLKHYEEHSPVSKEIKQNVKKYNC